MTLRRRIWLEPKAAKHRMRTSIPRKFTLVDAMVLIAAIGVALVPIRIFLWESWHFPDERSAGEIWQTGLDVNVNFIPLALTLSVALSLLGVRKPRPNLRRVYRRPGMAACATTVVYAVLSLIGYGGFLYFTGDLTHVTFDSRDVITLYIRIGMQPMFLVGGAVASVWIVLWLSGVWRAERSWIDRAGRALGIYWITISILFAWAFFMWG